MVNYAFVGAYGGNFKVLQLAVEEMFILFPHLFCSFNNLSFLHEVFKCGHLNLENVVFNFVKFILSLPRSLQKLELTT